MKTLNDKQLLGPQAKPLQGERKTLTTQAYFYGLHATYKSTLKHLTFFLILFSYFFLIIFSIFLLIHISFSILHNSSHYSILISSSHPVKRGLSPTTRNSKLIPTFTPWLHRPTPKDGLSPTIPSPRRSGLLCFSTRSFWARSSASRCFLKSLPPFSPWSSLVPWWRSTTLCLALSSRLFSPRCRRCFRAC